MQPCPGDAMKSLHDDWYDANNPDVSVIIQTFDASELTKNCLKALSANTFGYRYEIVIVDNGSAPEHVQALAEVALDYCMVRRQAKFNFSEGCNEGAQKARGNYLVFLNNDVFVSFNWLDPLIETLNRYPDAGAVGPKFLGRDDGLQEVGAFVDETGASIQVGSNKPYHPDEVAETRIVDYCSAGCLAVPKALFFKLRGFDPIFHPAYYEDVDLCLRIAGAGKRVYCCPESIVVHVKGATSKAVWSAEELGRIVEANRQTFLARWGLWLRTRADCYQAALPSLPLIMPLLNTNDRR